MDAPYRTYLFGILQFILVLSMKEMSPTRRYTKKKQKKNEGLNQLFN